MPSYRHPWLSGAYGTTHPLALGRMGVLAHALGSPLGAAQPSAGASAAIAANDAILQKAAAVGAAYDESVKGRYLAIVSSDKMTAMYRAREVALALANKPAATSGGGTSAASAARAKNAAKAQKQAKAAVLHVHAAETQAITTAIAGGTEPPDRVGVRDVNGRGGYVYRQYADGTIAILKSPKGGAAKVLRDGPAWEAITAEIGAFPVAQTKPLDAFRGLLNLVSGAIDTMPAGKTKQTLKDILAAGAAAASAASAGAAIGGSAAVAGLLTAAGASAAVPVAGWIVAGGLGLAAATISIIGAVSKANHGKAEATAKKHGIPDASELPAFTAKVQRLSSAKRLALGARLEKRAKRAQGHTKTRVEARLRIVAAVELAHRAKLRRKGAAPMGNYPFAA